MPYFATKKKREVGRTASVLALVGQYAAKPDFLLINVSALRTQNCPQDNRSKFNHGKIVADLV